MIGSLFISQTETKIGSVITPSPQCCPGSYISVFKKYFTFSKFTYFIEYYDSVPKHSYYLYTYYIINNGTNLCNSAIVSESIFFCFFNSVGITVFIKNAELIN